MARARSLRASWDAIARMIQRPVHDTRLAFDPAYVPDPMLVRADAPSPSRYVVPAPPSSAGGQRSKHLVRPGTMEARVLALLADGPLVRRQVDHRLRVTLDQARSVLDALRRKALIEREPGQWGRWSLNDAGRALAIHLAADAADLLQLETSGGPRG